MTLKWHQTDSGAIQADSQIWHDQGVALPYVIVYDIVEDIWIASFEGGEVSRGTLDEVIYLCQQEDIDIAEDEGVTLPGKDGAS